MSELASWLKGRPQLRQLAFPVIWLRRRLLVSRAQVRQATLRKKLLARIVDGFVTFDLPEFAGRFDVGIRSDISFRIMFEGSYEADLARLCAVHIDRARDAIDVGANVGLYTVLMAKHIDTGRRVLSIEPTSAVFELLVKNVSANRTSGTVICKRMAASAEDGELVLNIYPGREEYSSITRMLGSAQDEALDRHNVSGVRLDRLCADHGIEPGFMKIDVEGFEYRVLLGATKTLKAFRPVLLMEIAPSLLHAQGDSTAKILALLTDLGYRVVDAQSTSTPIRQDFGGYALGLPT